MLVFYFLLLICFAIIVVYRSTRDFDSLSGLLLLLLTIIAILIRTHLVYRIPSRLYMPQTFIQSLVLTTLVTFFSLIVISFQKQDKFKSKISYLLALYLFFGLLQQLLFQYVLLETVNFLSQSSFMAIFISTLFYSLFHTKNGAGYYLQAVILYSAWAIIYLKFGNLLPLVISHAILGAAYYPPEAIGNHSQIYRRLAFLFQKKS